jgi:DnaJ-class molecular chaperone
MFASCGREAIMVGMTCPDCSGTGKITLFTSAKPCKACGGTGKVGEKAGWGILSNGITWTGNVTFEYEGRTFRKVPEEPS